MTVLKGRVSRGGCKWRGEWGGGCLSTGLNVRALDGRYG
jgi:hypothetical protein